MRGQLPETAKESAEGVAPVGSEQAESRDAANGAPKAPLDVALPATLNGQIMPGGADRYRFAARKGIQLVAAVAARKLIPYLADAVPGWFQPALTLYDARGMSWPMPNATVFGPDPALHFVVPADGQYTMEIRDSIYRGREDFIYRIALGELPFVTGIFPLGGPTGGQHHREPCWDGTSPWRQGPKTARTRARESILGRPAAGAIDLQRGALCRGQLAGMFGEGPNDTPETAQSVTLPLIVNGRIGRPGDRDVFRFEGHAGQQIVAEVMARRLDSPLDSRAPTDRRGGPAVGLQRRL